MKILATFDGSKCAEAALSSLEMMARVPDTEVTLFSVARTTVAASEGSRGDERGAASDQSLADRADYLRELAGRLPAGPRYTVETVAAESAAPAIIQYALKHQPDVIVMATHGETGIVRRIFGDVAEEVVRSGVAPVLLVHPEAVRRPSATLGGAA